MNILKRISQIIITLTHPISIASRYGTPWDNVTFANIRKMYDNNQIRTILFNELMSDLGFECEPIEPRHLYDSHRTSGSISPSELIVISSLCQSMEPRHALEIGTFEGRTTYNLARYSHKVYTMNLPQNKCKFKVGKYFKGIEDGSNITQIFCDSQNYDFTQLPKMDLIFIDGDHEYESVVSDSDNAFKVLADNGIIVWHDVDTCHLGTTKAVLDAVKKYGYSYTCIEGTTLTVGYKTI